MERLRSLDSLSSTLTMRSNTCGGGPSIDSKVTVGPLPAIANEPLPAPLLAQPPRPPHAIASNAAANAERGAVRNLVAVRTKVAMLFLIAPSDIVKMC